MSDNTPLPIRGVWSDERGTLEIWFERERRLVLSGETARRAKGVLDMTTDEVTASIYLEGILEGGRGITRDEADGGEEPDTRTEMLAIQHGLDGRAMMIDPISKEDIRRATLRDCTAEIARMEQAWVDQAIAMLRPMIRRGMLCLWISHDDGSSALVTATSVCQNGMALQVEADPDWKFGRGGIEDR